MAKDKGVEPLSIESKSIVLAVRPILYMVPDIGLEPISLILARDFKSLVYTYSTNPAWYGIKDSNL